MNQYFENNQHLKSNRKELSFRFWCFNYSFISDVGVFSKDHVDTGTKVLLNQISEADMGEKILDMGCGIGVIAIVLKKLFPESIVQAVDVNPRALELTELNARRNEVSIQTYASYCYENVEDKDFSTIVSNPPIRAGNVVVDQIYKGAYDHLRMQGSLWVVIRKKQGAPSAKRKIEAIFHNCEIVERQQGYYVLHAIKS